MNGGSAKAASSGNGDAQFKSAGTWRRYKLGQAQFTEWLKKTADKVRVKDAVNGNGTKTGPQYAGEPPERVHLDQLEGLARVVADGCRPEDIPYAPIVVLRDVVELRKSSSRFYGKLGSKSGDSKIQAGNKTHEHAIKVLERVLKTLEGAVASVKDTLRGRSRDEDSIANMFELLQLQDSADGPEETETQRDSEPESASTKSKRSKKGKKGRRPLKPKKQGKKAAPAGDTEADWIDRMVWVEDSNEDDEEFDYYMLVYCFFIDFNNIRNYVAERWCDYFYDKSIHLTTLAVVSNAASELFVQMESDLQKELKLNGFEQLGDFTTMMETLFIDYGFDHIDYEATAGMTDDELTEAIWNEEANWVAIAAHRTVESILENVPPGKVPMIRPSEAIEPEYGAITLDQSRDFYSLCVMDYYREAAEVKALKKNGQQPSVLPAESELLLGFQEMLLTQDYPSSFVFSLQLHLDMRNIMEEQVRDNFALLQDTGKLAERKLQRYISWAPRGEMRANAQEQLQVVKKWILDDFTIEDKTRRLHEKRIMETPEEFTYFKNDPVWAGLLDFRTKLKLAEVGFNGLFQVSGFIRTMTLYHFAREKDGSVPVWPLMERFFEIHDGDEMWDALVPDRAIADILHSVRPHNHASFATMLVRAIDIVQFFLLRYGSEGAPAADRNNRKMLYIQDLRKISATKAFDRSGDSRWQGAATRDMTGHAMQHLDILQMVGSVTDYLQKNIFETDYLALGDEARVVSATLTEEMETKGIVAHGDEEWTELGKRQDAEQLLSDAMKLALGN